MRVSRSMHWFHPGLFIVTLLVVLGTDGCWKQTVLVPPGKKLLACATEIDVQATSVQPVYVCNDNGFQRVTWQPGVGVNSFSVQFDPNDCPFSSCLGIAYAGASATAPVSIVAQPPKLLKVYKYSIVINGNPPLDPHVVGGGGN